MRASGMLLPIASLPSRYGIGAFSKEAYDFVNVLAAAGQKYWQILPLGPTGYGDSPYQSFSTFAGNPYFIDLERLIGDGLLTEAECAVSETQEPHSYIEYEKIYDTRFDILWKAFERSDIQGNEAFQEFCSEQDYWLRDYALYMAVKNSYDGKSWEHWEDGIRLRHEAAMQEAEAKYAKEICFYEYLQYEFFKQWRDLKRYANEKGIQIIGDIPIYVAFDSADTWANPELFQLNEENQPVAVAGCPPDAFSATGQLWGNPLYKWEYHKETGYSWWLQRIAHCFQLYDTVRIDHFRGFDEYYAIPYGDATAERGWWEKGPGISLFQVIGEQLGELNIIAEDLGYLNDSVKQMLKDSGYPGMKVLEFAFDSREDSDYLPHNYGQNCVVYTGTHDNNTLVGWYREIPDGDKRIANQYLSNWGDPWETLHWELISMALSSVADTCIIPVQDYLGLGGEARINTPSTLGDNWTWRMKRDAFSPELIQRIREMTRLYARSYN